MSPVIPSNDCNVEIKDLATFPPSLKPQIVIEIERIEKKSFPRSEAFPFDTELRKSNTYTLLAILPSISSPSTSKAPLIQGYLIYQRVKRTAFLHKLCISEPFRNKGIGRKLIDAATNKLQVSGAEEVQLWVDLKREVARGLYTSCGFEVVDMVRDFYGPGRSAQKMSLRLVG